MGSSAATAAINAIDAIDAIDWTRAESPRGPCATKVRLVSVVSRVSDEGNEQARVTEPAETQELVRRAQRGDKAAFAELFRRHRSDVARLVFRMMGTSMTGASIDVEDVIQEVFLQVHRSLGEFRGQAKFSTWLHRVTVHVVLMIRRAARSRPVLSGEIGTDHEASEGPWPDEDIARRARIAAFFRLLDRISDKKRTVFILHELEGKLPAEIAEIVDAPVLTVRTRLFYARRELAQMMREEPALAHLCEELSASARDGERLGKQEETEVT